MKQVTIILFVAACVLAVAYAYPAEVEDHELVQAETGERVRRSPQYYGGYGGYNRGYGYGGYGGRGYGGYGGRGYGGYGGRGYGGYGGRGYGGYGNYGYYG